MTPIISEIQIAVCEYYGLSRMDMKSEKKAIIIARPRQVAMYLIRKMTPRTYPEIGRKFGDRDHATVIHGVRRIETLMLEDVELCNDVLTIRAGIEQDMTHNANRLAFGDGISGD